MARCVDVGVCVCVVSHERFFVMFVLSQGICEVAHRVDARLDFVNSKIKLENNQYAGLVVFDRGGGGGEKGVTQVFLFHKNIPTRV